jgi:hypothetical protein
MEFVVGNMLFAVLHEMGHAVMSEMELPVLGREEDAADSFAILAGLRMATDFSERALIASGKGWFFNHQRDREKNAMTVFYEAHGMNLQRAYQIVCFMVGAAPERFAHLAEATHLPPHRRETCKDDYAISAWSWDTLLAPHRRSPEQPKTRIDVRYDDAEGALALPAKIMRKLKFLETIAAMAADKFVWTAPFSMEMQSCGYVNAKWSVKQRRVTVCYELASEFANLYREFASPPERSDASQGRSAHAD